MTQQTRYYFHKDHLGSSTAMTDASGAKVETTEYVPYGEMRDHQGAEVTNYKFTDQELDPETGLYNYGARLYDPVIGRFISPDTIIPDVYDPQMLNRYSYCRNNPLIYTDPTGHYIDNEGPGNHMGADSDVGGGSKGSGDRGGGGIGDAWGAIRDFVGGIFGGNSNPGNGSSGPCTNLDPSTGLHNMCPEVVVTASRLPAADPENDNDGLLGGGRGADNSVVKSLIEKVLDTRKEIRDGIKKGFENQPDSVKIIGGAQFMIGGDALVTAGVLAVEAGVLAPDVTMIGKIAAISVGIGLTYLGVECIALGWEIMGGTFSLGWDGGGSKR